MKRFDSYMKVYMLQCHSPKSSHPLPLPLSPKVHYTHLCLICCLAYESPVCVRCRIQHAWGWCTGMTQRDVMGREVGGGVHVWERMYTRGGFMSMYGKTNTVL